MNYERQYMNLVVCILVDAELLLVLLLGLDEHGFVEAQLPLATVIAIDDAVDHLALRDALARRFRLNVLARYQC